jgi:hypothetical protein
MNNLLSFFFPADPWHSAWIRDEDGEVFPAKWRVDNGHVIVKTHTDRMVEGHRDGTTTRKQIAHWWPSSAGREYIEWVASSAPVSTP